MDIPIDYLPGSPSGEEWKPFLHELRPHQYKGKFIVFEGIDGSGKSTLMRALSAYLEAKSQAYVTTKTPSSDMRNTWIWKAFFDHTMGIDRKKLNVYGLAIMAFGDRLVHQQHLVEPALRQGKWVLCDRYIMSSTAHQCDIVHQLLTRLLIKPDLGILVDVQPEESIRRIKQRDYEEFNPNDLRRHATTRARLLTLADIHDFLKVETTSATVDSCFAQMKKKVNALLR